MTAIQKMSILPLLALLLTGCAANPSKAKSGGSVTEPLREIPAMKPVKPLMTVEEVEKARLDGDIGLVHPSFSLFPWLQFDPTDPRPQGFAIGALYLISNKTDKGVFGDGVITVRMYRVDRQVDQKEIRTLVHTWQFDPQQAMPYRSHRRTLFGEGYGLMLQWPKNLDLTNKEIMVIVEFTRPDGKIISANPKFLQVPDKVNG